MKLGFYSQGLGFRGFGGAEGQSERVRELAREQPTSPNPKP